MIVTAVSRNWRSAPVVIALAAAVTLPAVQYGALSSGGDDTVRQMARLVQQNRQADEQVGTIGVFVRNLVFYSGIKTTDVITDEQARDFLSQADRALMVVPARDDRSTRARARREGAAPGRAALFQRSRHPRAHAAWRRIPRAI